jgi:hypothetical protein
LAITRRESNRSAKDLIDVLKRPDDYQNIIQRCVPLKHFALPASNVLARRP